MPPLEDRGMQRFLHWTIALLTEQKFRQKKPDGFVTLEEFLKNSTAACSCDKAPTRKVKNNKDKMQQN